jgi:hypothetical protein
MSEKLGLYCREGPHSFFTSSPERPSSCQMDTGGSDPRGIALGLKLTIHISLVTRYEYVELDDPYTIRLHIWTLIYAQGQLYLYFNLSLL